MEDLLPFALLCFTSFFTLTNPLGTMPVFLTMTNGMNDHERKAIVRRATIVSFITLMVFTFSGQFLFKFFGISLATALKPLSNCWILWKKQSRTTSVWNPNTKKCSRNISSLKITNTADTSAKKSKNG